MSFSRLFNRFWLFGLLALFMLTSWWRRFCRVAGTDDDVGTDMGGDMAEWPGRHVGRTSDRGLTWVLTWRVTQAARTKGDKWFYRTTFGMEVVSVRVAPIQSNGDTHLLHGRETANLSEANFRTSGWLWNRRGLSDLGERIGGLTGCQLAGRLRRGVPPKY